MDDLDLAFTQYHTSFDENNVILCENELTAFKFEMFVNLNIDPFHRSNGFARFSLVFFLFEKYRSRTLIIYFERIFFSVKLRTQFENMRSSNSQ